MMKILMIGGTGTISSAITRQLAESGHELWLLNRGTRKQEVPGSVKQVIADIDDTEAVLAGLGDAQFDAVCEFIGFVTEQVERDIRLFRVPSSTSISRRLQRMRSQCVVRILLRVLRWQIHIGSIRATRLPARSC